MSAFGHAELYISPTDSGFDALLPGEMLADFDGDGTKLSLTLAPLHLHSEARGGDNMAAAPDTATYAAAAAAAAAGVPLKLGQWIERGWVTLLPHSNEAGDVCGDSVDNDTDSVLSVTPSQLRPQPQLQSHSPLDSADSLMPPLLRFLDLPASAPLSPLLLTLARPALLPQLLPPSLLCPAWLAGADRAYVSRYLDGHSSGGVSGGSDGFVGAVYASEATGSECRRGFRDVSVLRGKVLSPELALSSRPSDEALRSSEAAKHLDVQTPIVPSTPYINNNTTRSGGNNDGHNSNVFNPFFPLASCFLRDRNGVALAPHSPHATAWSPHCELVLRLPLAALAPEAAAVAVAAAAAASQPPPQSQAQQSKAQSLGFVEFVWAAARVGVAEFQGAHLTHWSPPYVTAALHGSSSSNNSGGEKGGDGASSSGSCSGEEKSGCIADNAELQDVNNENSNNTTNSNTSNGFFSETSASAGAAVDSRPCLSLPFARSHPCVAVTALSYSTATTNGSRVLHRARLFSHLEELLPSFDVVIGTSAMLRPSPEHLRAPVRLPWEFDWPAIFNANTTLNNNNNNNDNNAVANESATYNAARVGDEDTAKLEFQERINTVVASVLASRSNASSSSDSGSASGSGSGSGAESSPQSPTSVPHPLPSASRAPSVLLVLGRESHGLTSRELSLCDAIVTIPGPAASGGTNHSLNLAQAAGCVLYEAARAESQWRSLSANNNNNNNKNNNNNRNKNSGHDRHNTSAGFVVSQSPHAAATDASKSDARTATGWFDPHAPADLSTPLDGALDQPPAWALTPQGFDATLNSSSSSSESTSKKSFFKPKTPSHVAATDPAGVDPASAGFGYPGSALHCPAPAALAVPPQARAALYRVARSLFALLDPALLVKGDRPLRPLRGADPAAADAEDLRSDRLCGRGFGTGAGGGGSVLAASMAASLAAAVGPGGALPRRHHLDLRRSGLSTPLDQSTASDASSESTNSDDGDSAAASVSVSTSSYAAPLPASRGLPSNAQGRSHAEDLAVAVRKVLLSVRLSRGEFGATKRLFEWLAKHVRLMRVAVAEAEAEAAAAKAEVAVAKAEAAAAKAETAVAKKEADAAKAELARLS